MKTQTAAFDSSAIIKALEQHICDECKPFDVEGSFADALDQSGDVDVCGLTFSPSQIWKEMDPTAFRCGVNDHADSLQKDGQITEEIRGDYYDKRDADEAKESFVDNLRSELSDLESELEEMENGDDEESQTLASDMDALRAKIEAKQAEIDACESHSF